MSRKAPVRLPRLLPEILQAIYELKEREGSNSTKILDRVVKIFLKNGRCSANTLNNMSTNVRRALKLAETQGILKQRGGKFKINTNIVSSRPNALKRYMEYSRRPKQSEKRRRHHRRSSARRKDFMQTASISTESNCGESSMSELHEPVDETRSHRRRTGRRHRRRHRGRGVKTEIREWHEGDMEDPDDGKVIGYYKCENPDCGYKVKVVEIDDDKT